MTEGRSSITGSKPNPDSAGLGLVSAYITPPADCQRLLWRHAVALKKAEAGSLQIDPLKQGRVTLKLIGSTPLYFNAMSVKAKRTLLIGGGKKTAAEKRELKHDPEQEFRDSTYRLSSGPTLLGFPAPGIKGAMATAALETAGVTKTSVQRLIFLPQTMVSVWGRPLLKCDVVRSADMNKTPDIRTRAFLPRWAAEVEIAYISPTLSLHSVVSLLSNAGTIVGIGDFRQEKGRGSFGTFTVHGDDAPPLWGDLMEEGREAQEDALANPAPADDDTAELLSIIEEEQKRRAA